ncbi:MAG TPA: matrixin family metalloprotease [Candidatus Limnocylindria bacterium]|nr:matrixin family metalloprotease [Candidatus Limnocylindria bacterium]
MIAADSTYGFNGAAGWVDCPASAPQGGANPDHWCQQQWMRFNLTYTTYFDDTASRNSTACHELGHTLGLNHGPATTGSCMTANTPNGSTTIDAHDVAHINGYWRYQ